ncbi:MAG: cation transporter [Erysipelotrichaceae bacterium]|nr:cation transporter [Erysipelotrichaceae bacterium]
MSKEKINKTEREKAIVKVELVTLVVNTLLAFFKLLAGLVGNSMSMISDSIHSFSDTATTLAVLIGVKIASKQEDDDHHYGHEKIESVIGVVIATVLIMLSISIFISGFEMIVDYFKGDYVASDVSMIALVAAVVSIVMKEILYLYAIMVAKKYQSPALKADAWHHQSDCLSSIGSLIGISLAMFTKFVIADAIASMIIGICIIFVAIKILRESVDQITDKAVSDDVLEKARNIIKSVEGVKRIDSIKSRKHSIKVYFDVEISVEDSLSLIEAHSIAENVHQSIEKEIENVKHCTVHVNPEKVIH